MPDDYFRRIAGSMIVSIPLRVIRPMPDTQRVAEEGDESSQSLSG